MTHKLPEPVDAFKNGYPKVWEAFTQLGERCHEAGV